MEPVRPEDYRLPRELSAAFTGHRPSRLPWGNDESDRRCLEMKERLRTEIARAYREGARYFLSGMAEGFDLIAAETVLSLKEELPEIGLVAVFPYGAGETPRAMRAAEKAELVVSVCGEYRTGCFRRRNEFLVLNSSRLICGFGGCASSGTGQTIKMALDAGIVPVILKV